MSECCNTDPLGPSLAAVCNASNFIAFATILNSLIRKNNKISGICERVKPVKSPDDVYDFIVIGGGAGGSVVASRLSEIREWKILLLEAGPDEPAGAEIPSFFGEFLKTDIIWDYKTTNEPHSCLSTNRSCYWPSGKNLGGNTAHNAMIYLRGNPTDYNNWAALGNEGWTWNEVKPFFLKSEDNGEIERVGREHHATGGPLSVERFPHFPGSAKWLLDAAEEVGYGVSEDLNGDQMTGFSILQTTSKNGVRHSSASAYLRPARHRTNLHISLDSYVTRLIIKNNQAVGVEYLKKQKLKTVLARKEVILCGGAIKSPHILLLSGIGPKEHLENTRVKVILHLPGVGQNFHDHPGVLTTFTVNERDVYDNNWAFATEYLRFQTGPMSSTGLAVVAGLLATNMTKSDYPDIEINTSDYVANCAPGEIGALRSTGRHSISVVTFYLHPKSRGSVSLASNNPFDYPVLQANFFDTPDDLKAMVTGIKLGLKWMSAKALKRLNITLSNSPLAACSDFEFLSDEYWACVVQQNLFALYHQSGSCKMGNASDPMAVVDPRLRVYGIKGLRVADASIMPQVTSGNTVAPTMMIGERAADFIKKDHGR